MPRKKGVRDRRCACGKWTTAPKCRECIDDDGAGISEEELDALIAAQLPTMPDETVVKSYGTDRLRGGERESEAYRPPPSRFCRLNRRWNGKTF